ncbi:MAG TPA: hypothetical protein VOA87_06575, partial [Thermoanaerobaculia bacterium]|nr:hypothetical protein [Thermoanaerobaculia bacterium]
MAASTSSPCAARRPVRTLFASLLLCLAAAGPLDAAQPPSRLRLTVPAAPVAPGQEARLTIELLGEDRQPLATPRDRKVELRGADALSRITTVTIPAGSSAVEVAVTAPKPGLWQIEVASPGLSSAAGVVVSLAHPPSQVSHPAPVPPPPRKLPAPASAPRPSPTAIRLPAPPPAAGPQTMEARRPEPGALALKRPVASLLAHPRETAAATAAPSPSTASTGTMNAPPATSAPAAPAPAPPPPVSADGGHVELIAQPLKLRQGHQGWETSKVQAYWFAGEAPVPASRDLQLSLVLTGGSGNTAIDPGLLSIPHGAFMSPTAAQISARGIDTAVVKALYDGGVSQPVEISFL